MTCLSKKREKKKKSQTSKFLVFHISSMRSHRFHLEPKHFIYSHFQFFVFPDTDLSKSNVQNGLLYSDDAVQLKYYTNEFPKCPICLEDVVMPRLTSCGHMYCWRCLLQFLVLCPAPHKCPVCNALIYSPFTICDIVIQPSIQLGDKITMQLLKIPNGFTIPSLVPGETITSVPTSKCNNSRFYHVVIEDDPLSVLAKESVKVILEMKKPQDDEYRLYYNMMKEELSDLKKEWNDRLIRKRYSINPKDWNYYYQDSLGRDIYLTSFNLSMLMENPTKLPTFTSKILQIDEEDAGVGERKLIKSYQHIPRGTEIKLIEVDMNGLVNNSVMSKYIQIINKRSNARQRKIKIEKLQKEEERRKEEQRVAELKRMNEHYIYLEEDYELHKEEIEMKYFPSLGNNDKIITKKQRKKEPLFPSLGPSSTSLMNANNTNPTLQQSQKQNVPKEIKQQTNISSNPSSQKKSQKTSKKVKKSRKNKKILGNEFLGVFSEEIPTIEDMED
ncbi:hypothetical protein KM1_311600 [Entamoeba histolytica HM-3:IMSS]|uniref:RING-type domain-containing protein n=4 Tax=Entamoeba histolytica TaxID=5759 RepID=C4M849_ENTH1|nr:hypothetical protein EHI_052080 [Entamoeba histolytica HM-1:IMSS]EAL49851.2 hypothetical protein EHI_052080 [Entamoeba histolytica HM-1:IMSS]EMD49812.1 Hypothetical protein EHI5A_270620 [Entamoeba histolytica KU27]EMS11711.1 hypothetical protein KM1_311600 [Entamoeba histolytica HM-3:IMSS]GAT97739.1 hypothetical protein CL6EHI_052080 [Entamoeba histolytica]|eukprot:XP_655233.2 hypothetical protein EHI_052080 [Entamoeba histolytica HM-1:IMSS]